MSRIVSAGTIAYSQADFYQSPGSILRVSGIIAANLTLTTFVNSSLLSWSVSDGLIVPDSSISAGTIYFNEIPGTSGFYLIRFFPDRVGFWRVILTYSGISQEVPLGFDVVPAGVFKAIPAGGLTASFQQ